MKVSCILPTRNRRHMLPVAIQSYLSQDWPDKELVVVVDGEDVWDVFAGIPEMKYIWHPANTLSEKRNVAIAAASGEIICHFDDDDWSAPNRISAQMSVLSDPKVSVTGFHTAMFWDEIDKRASLYKNGSASYAWGPTLCYRKEYAIARPWPTNIEFCEDNAFIQRAGQDKTIHSTDGSGLLVARLHGGNARRQPGTAQWPYIDTGALPVAFREAIGIA